MKPIPKKPEKGSWIVTATCVVTKEFVCENCTESQAYNSPFRFAVEERETGMRDWDVTSVEPNE